MTNKTKKVNRKQRKNKTKNKKVKVFFLKPKYSDEHMKSKEGEYFEESTYDNIIKSDCDVYRIDDNGNEHLLLRFRKGVLPKNLTKIGMDNLKEAAMKIHDNRGASAGVIDFKKLPSYANDIDQFKDSKVGKFRIIGYRSKKTNNLLKYSFSNLSHSNIIGYFDKKDRNLGKDGPPCRTTAFTSKEIDKWEKVKPLIVSIDKQFKQLVPQNHKLQYDRAHETPDFCIDDTCFSTVTINYNWQTALHKDAGDYKDGFGNLVVIEDGDYEGGYTGFPQYGVAVDVRNGDFLAMDVHEWHSNTKLKGKTKDFTRLSLVCYLRNNMIKCKNM